MASDKPLGADKKFAFLFTRSAANLPALANGVRDRWTLHHVRTLPIKISVIVKCYSAGYKMSYIVGLHQERLKRGNEKMSRWVRKTLLLINDTTCEFNLVRELRTYGEDQCIFFWIKSQYDFKVTLSNLGYWDTIISFSSMLFSSLVSKSLKLPVTDQQTAWKFNHGEATNTGRYLKRNDTKILPCGCCLSL